MFAAVPFVECLALGGIDDGGTNDEIGRGHGHSRFAGWVS
jgi:hypothetical protein